MSKSLEIMRLVCPAFCFYFAEKIQITKIIQLKSNPTNTEEIFPVHDGNFDIKNSIRSILGFEAKKYTGGKRYESENKIDIIRVHSILVHCDIINSSRVNGTLAPVLYSFAPNVSPAEQIVFQPNHLIYVPLSLSTISSMTSWIMDQEGRVLDLGGEQLTLEFHIRKRR